METLSKVVFGLILLPWALMSLKLVGVISCRWAGILGMFAFSAGAIILLIMILACLASALEQEEL